MKISAEKKLNKTKAIFIIQKYLILYCFSVVRLNKNIQKKNHLIYLLKSLERLIRLTLINSVNPEEQIVRRIKCENNKFLHSNLVNLIRKYSKISYSNKTKTRSDLSYSKRKLWKQKGTGRARIGSKSSPILRGGSVSFGPKGLISRIKMNKKLKKLLFISSILYKIGCFMIFELLIPKDLASLKNKKVLLLISNRNKESFNMSLEFKNYANFDVKTISMVNSFEVLKHNIIIISQNDLFELFNRFLL